METIVLTTTCPNVSNNLVKTQGDSTFFRCKNSEHEFCEWCRKCPLYGRELQSLSTPKAFQSPLLLSTCPVTSNSVLSSNFSPIRVLASTVCGHLPRRPTKNKFLHIPLSIAHVSACPSSIPVLASRAGQNQSIFDQSSSHV